MNDHPRQPERHPRMPAALYGELPSRAGLRRSLGIATNEPDVDRFAEFASEFADQADVPDDLPPRTGC